MGHKADNTFFQEKKPWSEYKDLILGYYMEPYLAKVVRIGKPVALVDCFAGPGIFDDGKPGSPLIMLQKLKTVQDRGYKVMGYFVEKNPTLYKRLVDNTSKSSVPVETRNGKFLDYVEEIARLAKTHTVFVYIDPFKPSQLHFRDMQAVYDHLGRGQSVETLINFMSLGFLRAVWGLSSAAQGGQFSALSSHPRTAYWDEIAGGSYWQEIAFNENIPKKERADLLAGGYAKQLERWFNWVLTYPVREKYENEFAKYHLIFGSRWHEAVDLMNRAMLKARREFLGNRFVKGHLFNMQPKKEDLDRAQILSTVLEASRNVGKTTWAKLRAHATIAYPNMCTDSDLNRAIKEAIQSGKLHSNSKADKIENKASVWID